MFRRAVSLGILPVLAWAAIAASPALAAASPWFVSQISAGSVAPQFLDVSGNRAVWQGTTDGPANRLWTWSVGQVAPTLISESIMYAPPKVSGDRVAWIGIDDGWWVYTWTPGSPTPSKVASSATEISQLEVSGDRIAWRNDASAEVVTWKVGDSHVTTLNVGPDQAGGPLVSGDRVVWHEYDGSNFQIATWKSGEEPSRFITSGALPLGPISVSGDRIAWIQGTGVPDVWALMTQVASETVPTTVMVRLELFDEAPAISGDRIAWRQPLSGQARHQIITWHVGDADFVDVTKGEISSAYVDVSEDRIAWVNVGDVMTWKSGDVTPSVVATGLGPWATKVSGDRIVWLDDGRVMTAVLSVATTIGKPTISPTTPTHNKHAHFYAVLAPGAARAAAGATTTLRLYRKEARYVIKNHKRVKQYYWHLRNTVKMTGAGAGATVKLSATVTPKYAGSWRAIATYSGGPGYLGKTSVARDFTVR